MPSLRTVRNRRFHQVAIAPMGLGQIVVRTFDTERFQLVQRHAAVNHTIYQTHNFGAADRLVQPESTVRVALHPACVRGCVDITVRPVTDRNIIKDVAALIIQTGKARGHDRKLGAGYRLVRREFVFARAVHNAAVVQRFNFLVEPMAGLHVLERTAGHPTLERRIVAVIQAVEHGRGFRAGHGRVRTDAFVRVADDIGQVLMRVDVLDAFGVIDVGVVLDLLRRFFRMRDAVGFRCGDLLAVFRVEELGRDLGQCAFRRGEGRRRERRHRQQQRKPHRRYPLEAFFQKCHFLSPFRCDLVSDLPHG